MLLLTALVAGGFWFVLTLVVTLGLINFTVGFATPMYNLFVISEGL